MLKCRWLIVATTITSWQRGLGLKSKSWPWDFCVEFTCSFSVCVGVSYQRRACELTGDSKLVVNASVNG